MLSSQLVYGAVLNLSISFASGNIPHSTLDSDTALSRDGTTRIPKNNPNFEAQYGPIS
jgi:hypothetical protein